MVGYLNSLIADPSKIRDYFGTCDTHDFVPIGIETPWVFSQENISIFVKLARRIDWGSQGISLPPPSFGGLGHDNIAALLDWASSAQQLAPRTIMTGL